MWSPKPPQSSTLIFRDLAVGLLPPASQRRTWTLIRAARQVIVRFEVESANTNFAQIDPTSHQPDGWASVLRAEYAGEATPTKPYGTLTLTRAEDTAIVSGISTATLPKTFVLSCSRQQVRVHPAGATLVKGWKNDDDTMEPASWAPPRTDAVDDALVCQPGDVARGGGLLLPFTKALTFLSGRKTEKATTVGAEWAFVNSDSVIQEGALRWIPGYAVVDIP